MIILILPTKYLAYELVTADKKKHWKWYLTKKKAFTYETTSEEQRIKSDIEGWGGKLWRFTLLAMPWIGLVFIIANSFYSLEFLKKNKTIWENPFLLHSINELNFANHVCMCQISCKGRELSSQQDLELDTKAIKQRTNDQCSYVQSLVDAGEFTFLEKGYFNVSLDVIIQERVLIIFPHKCKLVLSIFFLCVCVGSMWNTFYFLHFIDTNTIADLFTQWCNLILVP